MLPPAPRSTPTSQAYCLPALAAASTTPVLCRASSTPDVIRKGQGGGQAWCLGNSQKHW